MRSKSLIIMLIGISIIIVSLVYGIGYPPSYSHNAYPFNAFSTLSSSRVYGIDVSHWQGTVNWTEVYNDGYRFAFVKATDGTTGEDSEFTTNMQNAHIAGLYVGAYHFAEPNSPVEEDAIEEADHFVNVISPYLTSGYLVPVLDLETNNYDLTWTELTDWANTFCHRVYNETGIRPIIYTDSYWAENLGSSVTQWDLWIADYTGDTNEKPSTGVWSSWSFWQYTDEGSVSGVSGNVDLDVFNGDLQTLQDEYVIKSSGVGPQPLYEHQAAYGYAYRWWNSQNPHYAYYSNSSEESANFASQALIAGGLSLWRGYNGEGGGLLEGSNGTIPSCESLHENLVKYQDVDYSYVTNSNFSVPENLEVGDVIIFGNQSGNHWIQAAIVVYRSGNSIGIAMHAPDEWNESIFNLFPEKYNLINYYHINLGVKNIIQPFKVTATALNVRVGPGTNYQIIGTIKDGQVYVAYDYYVDSSGRKWWKFFFDDRVGWCASWYTENVSYSVFVVNVSTYLNVRSGPGTGYTRVGQIYDGMLFARVGQEYNNTEDITWYNFWWSSSSEWCASPYVVSIPEFYLYGFCFILLIISMLMKRK